MALFVWPSSTVVIPGAATEVTLQQVETNTANTVTELQTLNGAVATEATLTSVDAEVAALNAKVTAVNTGAVVVASSALPTGAATESTLSTLSTNVANRLGGSLSNVRYDEVEITYVGSTTRINTVLYKLVGVTQRTLTFSYDVNDRLTDVVAS